MGKKDRNLLIMIIGAVILMTGLVFLCIWNYNPYYNDSVYVYSDKAPRVGNNLYGYIDVPKGFVLEGSFDSNSDNYAGGKDGTFDGVRLVDTKGKACITVSLVTPDRKKKDYVGFGFGAQALFDKKKHKMTGEYVGEKFLKILFEEPDSIDSVEQISTMEDYSSGHGCLKLINDMNGYSNTWYSKKGDTIFHNQMYYLEDPDCKNKIHCVCFTYTTDSLEYRDYINTFSMTKESTSEGQMNYTDSGIREGDVNIGYINLPKGYKKVEQTPFWKAVSAVEEAVKDDEYEALEMTCFFDEKQAEEMLYDKPPIFIGRLKKNDAFDQNKQKYMNQNLAEVFGELGLIDIAYPDDATKAFEPHDVNIKIDESDTEFGAKTFEKVVMMNLAGQGECKSVSVTLDGKSGYLVKWNGRVPFSDEYIETELYILDDDNNPDYVYLVGTESASDMEQMEKYLQSFSTSK